MNVLLVLPLFKLPSSMRCNVVNYTVIECFSNINHQLLSLSEGFSFFHVVLGYGLPINEHGFSSLSLCISASHC